MADTTAGTTTDHHQPADASASLRVLVVDDHALVRSGVRSELTAHAPDLDVIAKPFRAPASQAVPAEGPRAVQEEPEPLPLAVPHTGNVERTLSAHDFVDHHVDKPSGASAVSSAEKPQSGEAR